MRTPLTRDDVLQWLREKDAGRLEALFAAADAARAQNVGPEVHLRALVEISNRCARYCCYCGLRADNEQLLRYRMSAKEVMGCARLAMKLGYGTIVMQAGEDAGLTCESVASLVRQIKRETPLAVTLSLGERETHELETWREAGADRYLLRFETSDRELFDLIHPPRAKGRRDRIVMLCELRRLGYEAGSGIMVGIPGQSIESVADDIMLFGELDLDMIGIGPYIPHPQTPLGRGVLGGSLPAGEQVVGNETFVYKAVALTRLVCPQANIPSTSALATINKVNGRELGLARGANVVMPNLTPQPYRSLYQIYPGKACIDEDAATCNHCLRARILGMGRTIGVGPGGRRRAAVRQEMAS